MFSPSVLDRGTLLKKKPVKIGASDEVQEMLSLAWDVSGGDKEFIYMIETENSQWRADRQSEVYLRWDNGDVVVCRKDNWADECKREQSFGFCQIHKLYHPDTVNDKRFFTDERWQMEQCYSKFIGGAAFFGYRDHRDDVVDRFIF